MRWPICGGFLEIRLLDLAANLADFVYPCSGGLRGTRGRFGTYLQAKSMPLFKNPSQVLLTHCTQNLTEYSPADDRVRQSRMVSQIVAATAPFSVC